MIRTIARLVIAVFYFIAGIFHLATPQPFLDIMPGWVPAAAAVVWLTGVAELFGAIALCQPFSPALRRAGAWGLAAYALCVFPANINHFIMDMARADGGLGLAYHVPRMVAQPLLIAATLWAGEALHRPDKPVRSGASTPPPSS